MTGADILFTALALTNTAALLRGTSNKSLQATGKGLQWLLASVLFLLIFLVHHQA